MYDDGHSYGIDDDSGLGYVNDYGHDVATLTNKDDGHDQEHKHDHRCGHRKGHDHDRGSECNLRLIIMIKKDRMVNTIILVLTKTIRTMKVIIMMMVIANIKAR